MPSRKGEALLREKGEVQCFARTLTTRTVSIFSVFSFYICCRYVANWKVNMYTSTCMYACSPCSWFFCHVALGNNALLQKISALYSVPFFYLTLLLHTHVIIIINAELLSARCYMLFFFFFFLQLHFSLLLFRWLLFFFFYLALLFAFWHIVIFFFALFLSLASRLLSTRFIKEGRHGCPSSSSPSLFCVIFFFFHNSWY